MFNEIKKDKTLYHIKYYLTTDDKEMLFAFLMFPYSLSKHTRFLYGSNCHGQSLGSETFLAVSPSAAKERVRSK